MSVTMICSRTALSSSSSSGDRVSMVGVDVSLESSRIEGKVKTSLQEKTVSISERHMIWERRSNQVRSRDS